MIDHLFALDVQVFVDSFGPVLMPVHPASPSLNQRGLTIEPVCLGIEASVHFIKTTLDGVEPRVHLAFKAFLDGGDQTDDASFGFRDAPLGLQYAAVYVGVDSPFHRFEILFEFGVHESIVRVTAITLSILPRAGLLSSAFMPESHALLPPMSEAVTEDIKVEVLSQYSAENSKPFEDQWIFQYTVRITNQSAASVQLLSRHWIITDALDGVKEVKGPGVVGEQPVIEPGQSYKYSSWCPLKTPTGRMHGTYQMLRSDGTGFDIVVAPFGLKAKYVVN